MKPSEQSTALVSPTPKATTSFLDQFNRIAPIVLVLIAMFTAITVLVSYQTDLKSEIAEVKSDIVVVKSEINRVEQKIDTFQENIMLQFEAMNARFDARFDTLEQIFSIKVRSLEKDNENTEAIDTLQQTLNEPSQ